MSILGCGGRVWAAQNVSLAWNASTDTNVVGYALYCGTSSGNYTMRIDAGTNIMAVARQLSDNTPYYFVVTAYDSSGNESLPSAEVSLTTPGSLTLSASAPGTPPVVNFTANAGHWYELQATSDLKNWTTIYQTATATTNGPVAYQEIPAGSAYQQRYYRYVQH